MIACTGGRGREKCTPPDGWTLGPSEGFLNQTKPGFSSWRHTRYLCHHGVQSFHIGSMLIHRTYSRELYERWVEVIKQDPGEADHINLWKAWKNLTATTGIAPVISSMPLDVRDWTGGKAGGRICFSHWTAGRKPHGVAAYTWGVRPPYWPLR